MLENYKITFQTRNCIIFEEDNKIVKIISLPPSKEDGCDILNFNYYLNEHYTYNFKGLILITNCNGRFLYHRGKLICSYNS